MTNEFQDIPNSKYWKTMDFVNKGWSKEHFTEK